MQSDRVGMATNQWVPVLVALGFDQRFFQNKHGPCPICGGKDRFRFDDLEGRGTWVCNQCGAGDGYLLLQKSYGWSFRRALDEVEQVVGPRVIVTEVKPVLEDVERKVAALKAVWGATQKATSSCPVGLYLRSRGHTGAVPKCIRFHPALRYVDDDGEVTYHPAMVTAVTNQDGVVSTLHRTYLTSEGTKANVKSAKKLMPGRKLHGSSIKLAEPVDGVLGLAEGIETALASSRIFKVSVWSCVSSVLMETWEPPVGVTKVMIFGDNDQKFAGQAAAYALAKRLWTPKYNMQQVEVHIPQQQGEDWADA